MNNEASKTATSHEDDDLRTFGWFYGGTVYAVIFTPLAIAALIGIQALGIWDPFTSSPGKSPAEAGIDGLASDISANLPILARLAAGWMVGMISACIVGLVAGRIAYRRRLRSRRADPSARGAVVKERIVQQLDLIGRTFTIRSRLDDTIRMIARTDPVIFAEADAYLDDLMLVQQAYSRRLSEASPSKAESIRMLAFEDAKAAAETALAGTRSLDEGDAEVVMRYMENKYRPDRTLIGN